MDWNKLKAEYIAGGTSYRKLCQKYDVSLNTLQQVAKREKWCELKKQAQDKANTKIIDCISNDIANKNTKINDVADKLLEKIANMIEEHEEILWNSQSLKHITSALKDIKDIKGLKSDIDLREQEARINKLRKDAEEEQKDATVTVTFNNGLDKYSN